MADRPTPTQLVKELTKRFEEFLLIFTEYRAVAENNARRLESDLIDRKKNEDQLLTKIADLGAKNSALEERCRHLEKLSDRNWQSWLALSGAGLALLVALVKR